MSPEQTPSEDGGSIEGAGRVIDLSVEIAASPQDLWRCLTDPEELARWFPLSARVEPGEGGSIWVSWGPGVEYGQRIQVWDPPRHLRTGEEAGPVQLAVDWHIEGKGGTTVLRLVHSGFGGGPEFDAMYEGVHAGWSYFLQNLRHYLEQHAGTPRRMVWARRQVRGPARAVMARLAGREGFGIAGVEEPAGTGVPDDLLPGDRFGLSGLPVGRVEGEVLYHRPSFNFAGTLEELNDALLFLEMEGSGDDPWHAGVWISTYGVADQVVEGTQRWLDGMLDRLFPAQE